MSARLFDGSMIAPWSGSEASASSASGASVFRVLAVCTGNVARSPVIERLLQAELDATSAGVFEVRSAGTRALADRPMTAESQAIVVAHGGDPAGFRARQLSTEMLRDVDLVLTASHEHDAAVIDLRPGLLLKTFTLRELARIADAAPGGAHLSDAQTHSREFVRRASILRTALRQSVADDDDLKDPYGRGVDAYRAMMQQLVPAVRQLAVVLGASS
jgi:protein-tyrosine phosphatase